MGKKTKIEWCDATWNPVTGCLHGCEYCYARKIAERFGCGLLPINGEKLADLEMPVECSGKIYPYPFNFLPTFHKYRLDEPARWMKPRTIFVCSMADLFGDWVPDEWIAEVFRACEAAPQHRYLFLTKNPWRYIELDNKGILPLKDNMWYGMSVTDYEFDPYAVLEPMQEQFKRHIKTFISIEPMHDYIRDLPGDRQIGNYVDWVIIGAETGNRKGKTVPEKWWIDSVVSSCRGTYSCDNIPVFMKDSLIPIVGEQGMIREFPWENRA